VIVEELVGVEHREILNNRLFFKKLIEFIGDKPPTISSPVHLTVRGKVPLTSSRVFASLSLSLSLTSSRV
jgi:hypothetical protein